MDQQHKDDLARILANRRMGKRMLKPEQGSAPQSAGIGGAPPHNAPPPAAGSIHARTPGPTLPSPQSYAPAAAAPQLPLQQQASAAAASTGGDAGGYAPQQQHQAPAPKPQSLGSVVNSSGGVAAVEHTHQADLQVAPPSGATVPPAPSALSNPNSGAGAQPTPKMSLSSAVMMSSSPASSAAPTNAPRRPSDLGQQSITPMTSSNAPGLPAAQPHQHQQQNADVGGVQIQSGNVPGQPVSPASQGTDGVSPGLEVRTPPQRPAAGDSTDMNLLQDDVVPLSISAPVPASAPAPAAPAPAAAANSSKSAAPLPPSAYAVGAAPATPAVRTSADGQSTRNADGSFAAQHATPPAGSRPLPAGANASGAAAAPPPGYTAKQLESMLPPVQVQGTTGSTFQPLLSSTTPRLSYSQPRAGSLGGGYRAPSPYAGGGLGSTNLGGGTTFSTAGAASPYPVSAAGGGGQVTAADVMRGFEQIDSQAKRDASLPRGTATGGVRSSSVTNTNVFAGIGGISGGYSGGYSGVGGGYSASSAAPPLSIQASTAAYQSAAASGTGSYAQYRGGGGSVGGIASTAFSGPTGTTPITRTTRSGYTSPSRNGGGVLGGGLGGGGFSASTSSFAPRNYENFGAAQPASAPTAASSSFAASASSPPGSAFNRGRSGYQSQLPQDSAPSVIAGAGGAGGAPGVVRSGSAGRRGSVSFGAAAQAVRLGVAGVRSPQPPVHRQRSRSGGRESPKMVEFPAPYEPTESGDGGPEVIFPRDLTGVSSGVLTGATRTVGAATSGTGAGDVRTSMALLAKGDWWHKWDRNGRTVKPVYAFVDKNTLMWGRTPKTANALFSNFVQLEKIADVSSREIFDHTDHGARVFYVLEVHTMGRVLKIGTEKRAKLDSWYAALSDVVDFYRAQGIQGLSSNPAD